MLEITIKIKEAGAWKTMNVPDALSERITLMKQLAGTEAVIKLKTSAGETYLCGTDALVEQMHKQFEGKICMSLDSAHTALEYSTEHFIYAVQAFSTTTDVAIVFPDKPADYSKGWEHLKEAA